MLHPFFATCATMISGAPLSAGLPLTLLVAGFLGSWLHCTSMCGVNTISSTNPRSGKCSGTCSSDCSKSKFDQQIMAVHFHAGRMLSYGLLTVLTFLLFHFGFAWSPYRQFLSVAMLFLAGIMFLTSALPFFQRVWPWAATIQFPIPALLRRWLFASAHRTKHPIMRGFFVGFMPCGLLFSAVLAAAAAPHLGIALLSIMAFVVGTIPALVMVQMAGRSINRFFPAQWRRVQSGLLAVNGIFLITLGIYLAVTGF